MIYTTTNQQEKIERVCLLLVSALTFFWSISYTISLRILLLTLFSCVSVVFFFNRKNITLLAKTPQAYFHLSLTILIATLAFTTDISPDDAQHEFWSQWLKPSLIGFFAFIFATSARIHEKYLIRAIFIPIILMVSIHDIDVIRVLLNTGEIPLGYTIVTEGKTALSYVTNLAIAFICADILSSSKNHIRFISNYELLPAIVACLFCTYSLNARNGTIGAIFLILFSSIIFTQKILTPANFKKTLLLFSIFTGLFSGYSYETFKSDPRWSSLVETLPIALDTEKNRLWMYPENSIDMYPKLSSGEPVNVSNYMRIAWAKIAVTEIAKHPMGIGYTRHAFGDAVRLDNPEFVHAHSHSGILDFTISNGILGTALWLGFLFSTLFFGWSAFHREHNPSGLILFLIVSGFLTRSIVDSNIRDHMLEQFMFLTMIFTGLIIKKQKNTKE